MGSFYVGLSDCHVEGNGLDIDQAFYGEWVYVIISLRRRESPEVRAFRIVGGEVRELSLLVED